MCKRLIFVLVMLVWAAGVSSAHAQLFDSGSDGSFGPIDLPTGATLTLEMPADGIFNATTITVASGATLKFNRNPLNTPVYLLATGDVFIQGTVDVCGASGTRNPPVGGRGGPGGFDGGTPGFGSEVPPGAGHGPGAGLGQTDEFGPGLAAYGTLARAGFSRPTNGQVYGSPLLIPLVGGSGAGGAAGQPGIGGAGGGGAILIASNTRVDIVSPGRIAAAGGSGQCISDGSGGAIRLVAPVVAGNGRLDVTSGCVAGQGRIRVDSIDRTALLLNFQPDGTTTAVGGVMFVFSDVVPRLDIVEAVGEIIPEDQPEPVLVLLPFGSSTDRTVTVQARDFTGIVPIDVVLTPENGDRVVYPAQIDMGSGNPAQVVVDVVVPVNTITRVHAWTQSVP